MVGALLTLQREVLRNVRQVGPLGALRRASSKARDVLAGFGTPRETPADPFDSQYGTETAEIVRVGALDIPAEKLEHTNRYEAVAPEAFDAMMQKLGIRFEEFVFVDIGSGKGRALLLASRWRFKRVLGVEISDRLAKLSLQNIRTFCQQVEGPAPVEVVCGDALEYDLPDENLVVFLYNPFTEQSMRKLVANLEGSLEHRPRRSYVVYHRPVSRMLWDGSDRFRLLDSAERYAVYQSR